MLLRLVIKDLAVVESAELSFRSGMTAITGETGAGKSLLVDALLLIAGARADPSLIRSGAERAEVSALFDISGDEALVGFLAERELDAGGQLELRRVLRATGSRALINGHTATARDCTELAARLFEIHGQNAHQSLLEPQAQRVLLDLIAGNDALLSTIARLAEQAQVLAAERDQLDRALDVQALEALKAQVDALSALAPSAEDFVATQERERRLRNAAGLIDGLLRIEAKLDEDDPSVLQLLADIDREYARLIQLDPALSAQREQLDGLRLTLEEYARDLRQSLKLLTVDPAQLDLAERRLDRYHDLARRHRVKPDQLATVLDGLKRELDLLDQAQPRRDALDQALCGLAAEASAVQAELSLRRRAAAERLGREISAQLPALGMDGGRFEVELQPAQTTVFDPHGELRVSFLLAANIGLEAQPLKRAASGGELARLSLLLKLAAVADRALPTLIFDEVDAGIGGGVGAQVGRLLRELGHRAQVLCVTHLAQVASQAHQQFRVRKDATGGVTRADVEVLSATERELETARMLSGLTLTETTLAHARELLAGAERST